MEKHIKKLINEYEDKILDCDLLILHVTTKITELRRSFINYNPERKQQAILTAQRQAYVQAKVDIDSLLDYIETKGN